MRKPWLAGALALLALVAVPAALAGPHARARAEASVAKGSAGVFRQVVSEDEGSQSAAGAVSQQGVTIRSSEARVSTTTSGGKGYARATAVARSINLFGGVVTAYGARRSVAATAAGASYSGAVNGLAVDGRPIGSVGGPATYEFEGGTVSVNSGTYALLVTLTQPRDGYPAGTSVAVADVAASATDATRPQRQATPTPEATVAPKRTETGPREKKRKPRVRQPPARLLDGAGHVFPVAGESAVADDFHGPRQIGKHQGNDIFAPFGTPVVAVARGVVRKVGTLPISGNRLWLLTDAGDAYFYAHMSSFSPRAQNGRRVRAGTVLGFVGNTGDAEPTPPHLHFEIHPGGMRRKAVDPHEVLLTWQRAEGSRSFGIDTAGRPGALVEVRDFLAP